MSNETPFLLYVKSAAAHITCWQMLLSTYLAYSLKLAVSMETAFPRDFRAWEEAHISSPGISSSKPLTGSSSLFTGVTVLLPISASPAEQEHRVSATQSPVPAGRGISWGTGARKGWGSCFQKMAALGVCLKTAMPSASSTSLLLCNIFLMDVSEVEKVLYELNTT